MTADGLSITAALLPADTAHGSHHGSHPSRPHPTQQESYPVGAGSRWVAGDNRPTAASVGAEGGAGSRVAARQPPRRRRWTPRGRRCAVSGASCPALSRSFQPIPGHVLPAVLPSRRSAWIGQAMTPAGAMSCRGGGNPAEGGAAERRRGSAAVPAQRGACTAPVPRFDQLPCGARACACFPLSCTHMRVAGGVATRPSHHARPLRRSSSSRPSSWG